MAKNKKKTTRVPEHTFHVTESRGNLPYTVMWISKAGFPSIAHYEHYEDAARHRTDLNALGVRACLLINQERCDPF